MILLRRSCMLREEELSTIVRCQHLLRVARHREAGPPVLQRVAEAAQGVWLSGTSAALLLGALCAGLLRPHRRLRHCSTSSGVCRPGRGALGTRRRPWCCLVLRQHLSHAQQTEASGSRSDAIATLVTEHSMACCCTRDVDSIWPSIRNKAMLHFTPARQPAAAPRPPARPWSAGRRRPRRPWPAPRWPARRRSPDPAARPPAAATAPRPHPPYARLRRKLTVSTPTDVAVRMQVAQHLSGDHRSRP